MLESNFNKVAGLKTCSFIKKQPQHKCFPVIDIVLAFLLSTLNIFHTFFSVCIVDFEQVNVSREGLQLYKKEALTQVFSCVSCHFIGISFNRNQFALVRNIMQRF